MKPKTQDATALELFQAHFDQILNAAHPLVRLAGEIDWARFEAAFADSYKEELGAPGKAIRLMVGLQYLKFAFNESDESVVDRWVENPYWQYFCGFTHMQHEAPIEPKIGHLKSDHRVRRCFLSGLEGLETPYEQRVSIAHESKSAHRSPSSAKTMKNGCA